ncbi:uncharacterized protein LOC131047729 [Cryptomeria japonica]|uniref:uncharacterized protein LOC131047729 n=1 Tax=Cryptomeria japonica TaxID=3369 RepID=UPI0025ACD17F|nr:uncharacterized protein LOC131047729 [Cryptomeria japonica]
MGIALSSSSSSSSSPKTRPTAKSILDDGALREYEHPVKLAQVLNERGREAFFCLSDSINFNECLAPLPAHHELQLDRLYFLLPLTKLKYPLLPSEMAAMVLKAAAALQSKQNKHNSRKKRRGPKVVEQEMDERQIQKSDSYHFNEFIISVVESKRTTSRGIKFVRNKHKQSWTTKLAPIPETFAY